MYSPLRNSTQDLSSYISNMCEFSGRGGIWLQAGWLWDARRGSWCSEIEIEDSSEANFRLGGQCGRSLFCLESVCWKPMAEKAWGAHSTSMWPCLLRGLQEMAPRASWPSASLCWGLPCHIGTGWKMLSWTNHREHRWPRATAAGSIVQAAPGQR